MEQTNRGREKSFDKFISQNQYSGKVKGISQTNFNSNELRSIGHLINSEREISDHERGMNNGN